MTADQFDHSAKAWGSPRVARHGPGGCKSGIELYEAGKRRDDGRLVEIPHHIALACAALAAGLSPWEDETAA